MSDEDRVPKVLRGNYARQVPTAAGGNMLGPPFLRVLQCQYPIVSAAIGKLSFEIEMIRDIETSPSACFNAFLVMFNRDAVKLGKKIKLKSK